MPEITTRLAAEADVDAVAALFDGYRQFYGQHTDPAGAGAFIGARLRGGDSAIIVAEQDGEVIGFTQLYPSFSSVSMARIYILNDLFVAEQHRGSGAAQALLDAGRQFGVDQGAVRLSLTTQHSNRTAQALYEKAGWTRDDEFITYNLKLVD